MRLATVQYQIATYSGEVQVLCDDSDDNDAIIAKAKRILSRNGPFPLGYESFTITSVEDAT